MCICYNGFQVLVSSAQWGLIKFELGVNPDSSPLAVAIHTV
jgi:hypothetical protein